MWRGGRGVAALAALAVAAGCGDSEPSDDEADVRRAVDGFYTALEHRDGKRACAALTEEARREPGAIDGSGEPCEEAIVEMFGGPPRPGIASVEVDGSEATVQLTGGEGGTATLVKKDGRWRLDAF
jgi:hypothetical protein